MAVVSVIPVMLLILVSAGIIMHAYIILYAACKSNNN